MVKYVDSFIVVRVIAIRKFDSSIAIIDVDNFIVVGKVGSFMMLREVDNFIVVLEIYI